jgi:uncharacterized protein (TIGR01777 family)
MNILIAGASGFIGTLLVNHLSQHHKITVLGRNVAKLEPIFPHEISKLSWDNLTAHQAKQYDLIINLSGSSIGAKRWSSKVKKQLIHSRTDTNQQLIEWLIHHHAKPRLFCANAIGIYGAQDISTDFFDEDSPLPPSSDDFLQHIGLSWEQSLASAIAAGIPVTTLRFGVVLKQGEGMLKKLELPFRLRLGSILGTGHQALSWIYYKDLINAIDFLIEHPEITGPVNITSPYPITQKEFAQQLAKTLKRPLFLKTPGLFIKILFGEMGSYLLLKGQRVRPKRLNELGFKFTYSKIESALVDAFKENTTNKDKP